MIGEGCITLIDVKNGYSARSFFVAKIHRAMLPPIADRIASELGVRPAQISAAVGLLDEGATVPFIARYRKEVTGGLDDTHLRRIDDRLVYMRELEERRAAVIESIDEQGKLTQALKASILDAETKQRLEDLYLPYKKRRRTKAEIAREAGLEVLADLLLQDPDKDPQTEARAFLCEAFTTPQGDNPGVADETAALEGARMIAMDRFSEDAGLLEKLRQLLRDKGLVVSTVVDDKREDGAKFADYFDYSERLSKIPPHRALALLRGRADGVLRIALKLPEELEQTGWSAEHGPCERKIAAHFNLTFKDRPADAWIHEVVRMTWRTKLGYGIETTLVGELRDFAHEEAIRVFARNLKDLLLAAPAGAHATMGLDPGIRTGVKVAVVDPTGKLLDTATVYPFAPKNDTAGSVARLARLATQYSVKLVAIGNGTASRETDSLVQTLCKEHPELGLRSIVVSEAGASVYSASEFAAREFPTLDVSLRGAVSIARRLQDPLAELVKIDPKSIGVGQYQHDVNQIQLARSLDAVVEDCVNSVGIDVNTASVPLLSRVAGLTGTLAENVVAQRDSDGGFKSRKDLLKVPRLGPKAFEQCAGFLRIRDGDNPLDASAVHPEAYPVAKRILEDLGQSVIQVTKEPQKLRALNAANYTDDHFGLPTVRDILAELEKPGRDPRPEFKTATFAEGVNQLSDLRPEMVLEGVVTNVTNFGAFVDVGVHQDGLVHISAMANRFVKDPHELVKAGDVVRVRVLEVDVRRKRIGLSMRLEDRSTDAGGDRAAKPSDSKRDRNDSRSSRGGDGRPNNRGGRDKRRNASNDNRQEGGVRGGAGSGARPGGTMAEAFAKARKRP